MNLNEQRCYFQRCQKRDRNRNRREIIQRFFFIVKWLFSLVHSSIRDALVDFNQTVFDHFVGNEV